MKTNRQKTKKTTAILLLLILPSVFISLHLCLLPGLLPAQAQEEELVANLAAGRVVVWVARDAIVVGTGEKSVEPGSHPPLVVPLGGQRLAILLGAVEWLAPASGRPPVRLDAQLASLASEIGRRVSARDSEQASDIEEIGVGFLEQLRPVADRIYHKLELQLDEPLVELILVDYEEGYGPEVWELRYRIAQEVLRGDFWRTRVLRPSYIQLYPPEKGQPRTLVEVRYPPEDPGPSLLELVRQNDPRFARLATAEPALGRAAEQLAKGEPHKAKGEDATAYLRAVLPLISPEDADLTLGVIYEERGFQWVLAPPDVPAGQAKPREPSTPTLRKKP